MSGDWRASEIRRRLAAAGFVETRRLAAELEVDVSTIRRDLDRLARAGQVRRTHGGAMLAEGGHRPHAPTGSAPESFDVPYVWKERERVEAKRAIGEHAAALVADGDSLVLDSGSTTYAVARALVGRHGLSIVTNDVHIAHMLASRGGVRLLVTGGQLIDTVFTLVGPAALESLAGLRVDWAFLGADAIDAGVGVTNRNTVEVPVKRAMLDAAARRVLVADSTKFGRRAMATVCGADRFDAIVTDDELDASTADAFGTRLVRVPAVVRADAGEPASA